MEFDENTTKKTKMQSQQLKLMEVIIAQEYKPQSINLKAPEVISAFIRWIQPTRLNFTYCFTYRLIQSLTNSPTKNLNNRRPQNCGQSNGLNPSSEAPAELSSLIG